jgi:hypothetical protein
MLNAEEDSPCQYILFSAYCSTYEFHVFKPLFSHGLGEGNLFMDRYTIDRFLGNCDHFIVVLINILATSIMAQE